jgi:hypothetical protein
MADIIIGVIIGAMFLALLSLIGHIWATISWVAAEGTLPFYFAGLVGFILLAISVSKKNTIIGALGAGLVATAFSHWIGPITFLR